jgi:hypothetical protein
MRWTPTAGTQSSAEERREAAAVALGRAGLLVCWTAHAGRREKEKKTGLGQTVQGRGREGRPARRLPGKYSLLFFFLFLSLLVYKLFQIKFFKPKSK